MLNSQSILVASNQKRKVAIPCSTSFEIIQLSQIIRCEGMQNYSKVYLTNGNYLVSSSSLGVYKKNLTSLGFFSCHKSHLINEEHIVRYLKDGRVEMSDESIVPVARRKREQFMDSVIRALQLSEMLATEN